MNKIVTVIVLFFTSSSFAFGPMYGGLFKKDDTFLVTSTKSIYFSTVIPTYLTTYESTEKKNEKYLSTFVEDNLQNLANDIAKGSGEYIEELAELQKTKETFSSQILSQILTIFFLQSP